MFHLLAAVALQGTPVDFDREVLPILSDHCYACHGPDAAAREGDLRLDSREGVLRVAEPGAPDASELFARVSHAAEGKRMPPRDAKNPLTAEEIDSLRRWIEGGITWEAHWSFQAPEPRSSPQEDDPWCRDPIDGFVLERLRENGLEPSPPAQPGVWLRRVTLDLTGLPPTLEALDRFEADLDQARDRTARDAVYASVVDALLASTGHAEHRTRQWLDVARYADTNGYQNDFRRDQWPWRDWVLRAYRDNMPYDQFVVEQVAGDLIPDATVDAVLATGFQRNHRTVTELGSIDEEWRVENVADRAETTATAFLGLTLACARCHDHKYDPLSQQDYYGFYGFFNSIDEQGVYGEARGNVAPTLKLPTQAQGARIAELESAIADLEAAKVSAAEGAAERHDAWLAAHREDSHRDLPTPRLTYAGEGEHGLIELPGTVAGSVDLGRGVDFEGDRPFTVSLWLKAQGHGAVYSCMDDDDRYRGTDLVLLGDMRPAVHLIHAWNSRAIKVVGVEPLETGRWHHLAVAYDGTSSAAGVTLHVNGQAVEVVVEVDTLEGTIASTEPLRLGTRRFAGELEGALLDVRVDSRALRGDEVRALAAQRATGEEGLPHYLACFDGESRRIRSELSKARRERIALEGQIATAMVLRELEVPRETRVLERGLYDRRIGDPLTPNVPEVLGALPEAQEANRLALARWLVADSNPLTARVAANRVWQGFFGVGLVDTQDDFGTRGGRPSHPALLDRLALDLVEDGWDLRKLERRIALSSTYMQSSAVRPEVQERDPSNRLLARGPRRRLDAETVRDQALAVSGLLAERWGGPSVKPYQPEGLWKELAGGAGQGAYVPSQGEDLFRRSLYTYRKRTVPHPTLTTFDAPGFELCTVRRSRTNTPLQALAVLNDTTYVEAAWHLAAVMMEADEDPEARLRHGVRRLLGRWPGEGELGVLRAALDRHRAAFEGDPQAARALLGVGTTAPPPELRTPEWAAYTLVASTLLNLDEALSPR